MLAECRHFESGFSRLLHHVPFNGKEEIDQLAPQNCIEDGTSLTALIKIHNAVRITSGVNAGTGHSQQILELTDGVLMEQDFLAQIDSENVHPTISVVPVNVVTARVFVRKLHGIAIVHQFRVRAGRYGAEDYNRT